MKAKKAKELASKIFKTGVSRIKIAEPEKLQEAITKDDVRGLIAQGVIKKKPAVGTSKGRSKKLKIKKKKGRKKGFGKRKGTRNARQNRKKNWIQKVRGQRKMLKELNNKNKVKNYQGFYRKIKGSFFRGKKHLEKAVLKGE